MIGDVALGEECSVWPNAVIRGDTNRIRIGARTNVQDGAVIHADPGEFATTIGAGVTSAFVLVSIGVSCGGECGEYLLQALAGAAIWGAGIGALVDACILTPQDIFRTGPARVAVRPAVGRGRVGATVTMRW